MTKTDMYIVCPDETPGKTITCARYDESELRKHHTCILQKLISIAGIKIEDEELEKAFKSHYNLITDYKEFENQYKRYYN